MLKKSNTSKPELDRNQTGSIPMLQPTIVYQPGNVGSELTYAAYLHILNNPRIDWFTKTVISVLITHGLRVGEVINIKFTDISEFGKISIAREKGSHPVVIVPVLLPENWLLIRRMKVVVAQHLNRMYIHRLFVKHGIYAYNKLTGERIVTHVFRHIHAGDVELQANRQMTSAFLGHKNMKSTDYYINKLKIHK